MGHIPVGVDSRTCLTNLFCEVLVTCQNHCTEDAISLFGEVARHSGLYGFHRYALCPEASRRELFTKIPSLPLVLGTALFQSLSKVIGEDGNTGRFES